MPTIHIPNNMYPAMDGTSLFTERVKSFIQSAFSVGAIPTVSSVVVPMQPKQQEPQIILHPAGKVVFQ